MYMYTAYNLCIHSEIALPELVQSEGLPDVTVRLAGLESDLDTECTSGNRLLVHLKGFCKFLVTDGREITIAPESGIEISDLGPSILGTAMSIVLEQRGLLVLHASSVAINGHAVAFMGGQRWGKSTMAKAFYSYGYPAITDDVLAVKIDQGRLLAIPGFPQFKLYPEAAEACGHDSTNLSPLFNNSLRLSCTFEQGFQETPLPLQCIYVLAKGTQHEIAPLSRQDALVELKRHTRSTSTLTTPDAIAAYLDQCDYIITTLPFRRFTRQPSLADLPKLICMVETDLAQNFCLAAT